ncbi:MAG: rhomboid family intramembrane serine protease [Candidatus Altiarchaeota archaeon]|nr:rhomboid family intramembrane serine protease [Candidatus Altiarchaeota archaeon]
MKILGVHIGVIEALLSLNALMFLVRMLAPIPTFSLLALQPATILQQPWTLVTSMFLHADLTHIIFNMFALYFFGNYLQQLVGEKNLLKAYFLGGIGGGLLFTASALILGIPDPETIGIGASDGIFALAGALAILRPYMRVMMMPIFIPMPLYISVFVFMVALSFMPGVAWQAHLGGLIVGAIFGLLWKRRTVEIVGVQTPYGYRFY